MTTEYTKFTKISSKNLQMNGNESKVPSTQLESDFMKTSRDWSLSLR
jgi:hypothetical protein